MSLEQIDARIDFVRANIERLTQIPQSTYEEFSSDFRNLDSALYRLQTTIQGLMDLGSHLCATLGLETPSASRDILQSLETAGRLPAGSTDRFGPMFAFRNRVVHPYDRIDPRIAYRILHDEHKDLQEFLGLLLSAMK